MIGNRLKRAREARVEETKIIQRLRSMENIVSSDGGGDYLSSSKTRSSNPSSSSSSSSYSNKGGGSGGPNVSFTTSTAPGAGDQVQTLQVHRRAENIVRTSLLCTSHGSVSLCGRRREMEDCVTVEPGFLSSHMLHHHRPYDFFAVYDGHGGSRVAQFCRDRLHRILANEIESEETAEEMLAPPEAAVEEVEQESGSGSGFFIDWEKVMFSCFSKMDEEINGSGVEEETGSGSMKTVGSTAVVAVLSREKLVVANCGDSRAVLSRGGGAIPLSRDHKPDRPDELERVEAAGGRVINWNGYRVLGVLATSRSIGDHYLKPYVISEPEVTVVDRAVDDEFLILASDGLWDVISNEIACEVVRKCIRGRALRRSSSSAITQSANIAGEAAAVLAELAMARGSKDNISVVVVELGKSNG